MTRHQASWPPLKKLRVFNLRPHACEHGHLDCSYADGAECSNETACVECQAPFGWHDRTCSHRVAK